MNKGTKKATKLTEVVEAERSRIVRLCTRITNNYDVAEDLAQETLVEAWCSLDNLRDPNAGTAWLNGIARNVCRRWVRRQGRELSRIVHLNAEYDKAVSGSNQSESGEYDLEVQLERTELIELLNKALNLLPPVTRSALIQQFVDERPQHEIAERLGMSRGAVAMRIQRGKLLLRQTLLKRFPEDAESFGLLHAEQGWMETTIWCPLCGDCRFQGLTDNEDGWFYPNCRGCFANSGIMWCEFPARTHENFTVGHGYRATYDSVVRFMREYLLLALTAGHAECLNCGSVATLTRSLPDIEPWLGESYGVHLRCPQCSAILSTHLSGMLLSRSEGYRFWHEHSRIRSLPEAQIEADGRPAIVSRFESVSGAESLVVITDAVTLSPIQFHRTTR